MRLRKLPRNPMLRTLVTIRNNQRACLWLEPLWGIPYNLYEPFVSVYMAALGMSAVEIGAVTTVFFASQTVWALLSGALTDKLGRRLCTVIFDVLSWSVPALIWMCAQNFWWFIVAALFNGAWRVTENSWGLLLVDDAEPSALVNLFSLMHIAGLVAGFVAPLAYFFVREYSVVPTMRALYGFTFVMMTAKFLLLFALCKETSIGVRRREACKNVSFLRLLAGSGRIFRDMLRNRRLLCAIGLLACFYAVNSVHTTFWPLMVTNKLGIDTENLSVFSTLRSLAMLLFFFTVVPKIQVAKYFKPLIVYFSMLGLYQIMLFFMPAGSYALVILGVLYEALALSCLKPLMASLEMLATDSDERARTLAIFYALTMITTAPFGVVAGKLADINGAYPFLLNLVLILIGLLCAFGMRAEDRKV